MLLLWRVAVFLALAAGICSAQQSCVATGGKTPGRPCVFPFTVRGKTYNSCTYDFSFVVGSKPWCSTKTDERGKHINGNVGTCEDPSCPIPPRECGVPVSQGTLDKSKSADITQVPWMASLGHHTDEGEWKHECGGSLLNNYYVLTAAHCFQTIELGRYMMRLGSASLTGGNNSPGLEERLVKKVFTHERYRFPQVYYDVGLALAQRRIEFTDYVRPVCLPSRPVDDVDYLADNLVILSGWGQSSDGKSTNLIDIESIRVNSKDYCSYIYSAEYLKGKVRGYGLLLRQQIPRGFTYDISCAGLRFGAGSCFGDSGSPLVKLITNTARSEYYEQEFVVSSGIDCNLEAQIFVRLADRRVLDWIHKTTDTGPMLMVAGGYNDGTPNGLTHDVELVSSSPGNKCTKRARPITGKWYDLGTHIETDAATLGMVGEVTHDSIMLCGGKNGEDNQKRCHNYHPITNTWDTNPSYSMKYKRNRAAAVLNEEGDLWVIGGINGSDSAYSTEIFDFRKRRWREGTPLPNGLHQSGISSHCAIALNGSHVFMAGGFASDFILKDPLGRPLPGNHHVPGQALDNAWMFVKNHWETLPSMSSVRDRPACSLVQTRDGRLKVLVAGGCQGWCSQKPAIKSVEMYDPDTNSWKRVRDLPFPIHSAGMALLDGLPTLVGGFNQVTQTQSRELYQYHVDSDQWRAHPTAKLRMGRSSPAVFQVSRQMIDDC